MNIHARRRRYWRVWCDAQCGTGASGEPLSRRALFDCPFLQVCVAAAARAAASRVPRRVSPRRCACLSRARAAMSASPDVVWQVIKKQNCFLRKGSNGRADPIFSAEPRNLYARHSFKYSGARRGKRRAPARVCLASEGLGFVSPGPACDAPPAAAAAAARPGQPEDGGHRGRVGRQAARGAQRVAGEAREQAGQARVQQRHVGQERPQGVQGGGQGGGQVPARPAGAWRATRANAALAAALPAARAARRDARVSRARETARATDGTLLRRSPPAANPQDAAKRRAAAVQKSLLVKKALAKKA